MKQDTEKKRPAHRFKAVSDGKQTHERIVDQLKHAIFEKKILPGERLPTERDLAQMFRTSRVTVRGAILSLRNAGLVHVRKGAGGGIFVVEDIGGGEISELLRDIIRWKDISIQDVVQVRFIIEPEVAYLAAKNATDDDIQAIWAAVEELGQFFAAKSQFKSTDENFHKALAVAAKNPLLAVFQASLIDLLFQFIYDVVWQEEHKGSIFHYHKTIAKKVEERDPVGARQAMISHLEDMQHILSTCPVKDVLKWIKYTP
jgi:GntR family transcriptional repressor for pyruvate dehydrogenase complex